MDLHNRYFETKAEYDSATKVLPNVSYVADEDKVYYNPFVAPQYLCFTANTAGSTIQLMGDESLEQEFECKINGNGWTPYVMGTVITLEEAGDKFYIRNVSETNTAFSLNSYYRYNFVMTGSIAASGDITCLVQKHGNMLEFTEANMFCQLFMGCRSLTSAPALPTLHLTDECYSDMFNGCQNLTSAPELPATTLAQFCYSGMFAACGLTSAPALPATSLEIGCYQYMFDNCTQLETAPELPALIMKNQCYKNMFSACTALTTAPELPATQMDINCYQSMFEGCSVLVIAPELPATEFGSGINGSYKYMFKNCTSLTTVPLIAAERPLNHSYEGMFTGCESLNYIKCLATNVAAADALTDWVDGVASTGTFVKSAGVTWSSGASGIPEGWTVEEV